MKSLLTLLILIATSMQNVKTIFDFTQENDGEGWYIVNDGVMGGLSKGQFLLGKQFFLKKLQLFYL